MIFVLLQNAWASRPMSSWPYRQWVRALRRSRSGTRLARIFPDPWDPATLRFGNTTPNVGTSPDSQLPAQPAYVRSLLARYKPKVLVACGKQAEAVALEVWAGAPGGAAPPDVPAPDQPRPRLRQ